MKIVYSKDVLCSWGELLLVNEQSVTIIFVNSSLDLKFMLENLQTTGCFDFDFMN